MPAGALCAGQELIELEAFSCLKQSISIFILEVRACSGLLCTHLQIIANCELYFNNGPVRNQCLRTLIEQLSASAHALTQDWVSHCHLVVLCGVTGEPLTDYCLFAMDQTKWSNPRCEVGPRLK